MASSLSGGGLVGGNIKTHLVDDLPLSDNYAPSRGVPKGPLLHVAGKFTKMPGPPVPNMRVAGRIFSWGVHGAVSEKGDPPVVPGIGKGVQCVVSRANQTPKTLRDQDGIQPSPLAGPLNGDP